MNEERVTQMCLESLSDGIVVMDDECRALEILFGPTKLKKFLSMVLYPNLEMLAAHALAKQVISQVLRILQCSSKFCSGGRGTVTVKLVFGYGDTVESIFESPLRMLAFEEIKHSDDDVKGFSTLVDYTFNMPPYDRVMWKARFLSEFLYQLDEIFKQNHEFCEMGAQWEIFFY